MSSITPDTSMLEIAVLVSEALEAAGISAVLGGGGAVSQYSDNEYMTTDLDFITIERNKTIAPVVAKLGFTLEGKDFHHPKSRYFLEFPPGYPAVILHGPEKVLIGRLQSSEYWVSFFSNFKMS